MAPTPEQYKAALDALEGDAKVWEACGNELTTAGGVAAGLTLDAAAISYVADKCGITAQYTELQQKLQRLLTSGGEYSTAVAGQLRAAAATYDAEEQAGVHRMNDVW
ncbi:hypothetical protein [Actinophytocola sediminis]